MRESIKSPLVFVFLIVVLISWCTHISFRNDHFQDVDSATVYPMMHDFPGYALRSTALFYPAGHIFSTSTAQRILDYPLVRSIKNKHLGSLSDEFIINQLTKTSLTGAVRFAFIQAVEAVHLPFSIRSFFALPLSSTYSAGPGLVYGLISGPDTSYENFMSRSTVVTITLFHFSILLLFLINRKLGVSDLVNIAISFIALFSVSFYSSGLHLGSTVWNFFTEFFWIWYFLKNKDNQKVAYLMSRLTAVLVFFNYLIIFLWIPYVLCLFAQAIADFKTEEARKSLSTFRKGLFHVIRTQKVALVFISICGIIFFQSGQGFRGGVAWADFLSYIYYGLLNFTSWYTHSHIADAAQFILTLGLICLAFSFLAKKDVSRAMPRQIFLYFLVLYAVALLFKVLSFLPTRHVLFLAPVLFISAAIGLDSFIGSKVNDVRLWLKVSFAVLFAVLGLFCLQVRRADVADLRPAILMSSDIPKYGIYDLSHDLYYYLKDNGKEVESINPAAFKVGEIYLFVSHSEPFNKVLEEWRIKFQMEAEVLWERQIVQPVYFIAYNPDFTKLRYSRPNNLFQTKFKVVDPR